MDDLISRQAAIDALNSTCDRVCHYSKKQRSVMCSSCPLGSAFDVLDELPSAERRGEWISVKERLPEEGERVLCQTMTKKGSWNFVIGYHADGRWCCGMNSNVVAWKPFSEPFKERWMKEDQDDY